MIARNLTEHCDLVAVRDERFVGVQVKTSTCFRNGRWDVTLCTRGGNQSWSGIVKRFDSGVVLLTYLPGS